jgi:hypothetical protein
MANSEAGTALKAPSSYEQLGALAYVLEASKGGRERAPAHDCVQPKWAKIAKQWEYAQLKIRWLAGTHVTRCYAPPLTSPCPSTSLPTCDKM